MMALVANMIPMDAAIEQLEEAISEVKEAKVLNKSEEDQDETLKHLAMSCFLIHMKYQQRHVELDQVMDAIDKADKLTELDKRLNGKDLS